MTSKEFQEILHRYLNDKCTDAEKQLVEDWFLSMEKELDNTGFSQDRLAIKDRLWSVLESQSGKDHERYTSSRKMWRVAAAIAAIAVSTFLVFRYAPQPGAQDTAVRDTAGKLITLVNAEAMEKRVELSDGSYVLLQPGAEIRYPETFSDNREVYLTGEAFFQVTKDADHPFLVYANEVTTKVLGTSFTVKAQKDAREIVVEVKTGKVSVVANSAQRQSSPKEEIILTPNQLAVYDRETDQVTKDLVEQPRLIAAQTDLKMSYTDAPVTEVFEALEKSYGVHFIFDRQALSRCTLTTDMAEEGLYERLEIICHALGAEYKVENAEVTIHAKGCN